MGRCCVTESTKSHLWTRKAKPNPSKECPDCTCDAIFESTDLMHEHIRSVHLMNWTPHQQIVSSSTQYVDLSCVVDWLAVNAAMKNLAQREIDEPTTYNQEKMRGKLFEPQERRPRGRSSPIDRLAVQLESRVREIEDAMCCRVILT